MSPVLFQPLATEETRICILHTGNTIKRQMVEAKI